MTRPRETCECGARMELAWITYNEGKPEKAAWKCVSCKKIRKDFIHKPVTEGEKK